MFGTVEAEIAAENQHRTNVIDERNLEKYHDQLSSFNTQATLVLGFAVAGLNSDNLLALGDDQSKYCLYKSGRMGWGYAYGLSTCLSISTSLTCIAASFYLIVRSQHFALNVGVRPALAMVRVHQAHITSMFVFGLLCFLLSAIATVWLFVGFPNYRKLSPAELPALGSCAAAGGTPGCSDGGWGSNVVHVDDGSTRASCLNPHSAEDLTLQERVTREFALAVTGTFAACLLLGAGFLTWIKYDFDRLERALLSAADKSEREREMDSIERRRAGGGDGDGMHLSDSHVSSVSMEATSSRVAVRSVGRA